MNFSLVVKQVPIRYPNPLGTECFSCIPRQNEFQYFCPSHLSRDYQNFFIILPPNTKFGPIAQISSSAAYYNSPLPITFPSLLANTPPYLSHSFNRRTSGHSLWIFRALYLFFFFFKFSACHCTNSSNFLLLLLLPLLFQT